MNVFLSIRASNFWCFKIGVERVRYYMTQQQMELSKLIWFTEFGFSSFNGWNGARLQGQVDHLERAIDIIQTQWPFVHAACVYEYLVFTRKVKNTISNITIASPTTIFPRDVINTNIPYISLPSIPEYS
jgi:hypothetical protein